MYTKREWKGRHLWECLCLLGVKCSIKSREYRNVWECILYLFAGSKVLKSDISALITHWWRHIPAYIAISAYYFHLSHPTIPRCYLQVLVPLKTVRQGFRHLPLCARDGSTLEPASVFVHIDLKDQLDISIKKGIIQAKKKSVVPPKTERLRETGLPNIGTRDFNFIELSFSTFSTTTIFSKSTLSTFATPFEIYFVSVMLWLLLRLIMILCNGMMRLN